MKFFKRFFVGVTILVIVCFLYNIRLASADPQVVNFDTRVNGIGLEGSFGLDKMVYTEGENIIISGTASYTCSWTGPFGSANVGYRRGLQNVPPAGAYTQFNNSTSIPAVPTGVVLGGGKWFYVEYIASTVCGSTTMETSRNLAYLVLPASQPPPTGARPIVNNPSVIFYSDSYIKLSANLASLGDPSTITDKYFYFYCINGPGGCAQGPVGFSIAGGTTGIFTKDLYSPSHYPLVAGNTYGFNACATNSTGTGCAYYSFRMPEPQVTLRKTPTEEKNTVKAGVSGDIGSVYFNVGISNLPANTTCRLKNLSKSPENQLITTFPGNGPYNREVAHTLISGQNNFQVQCENSAGATTHSSNTVMTEGQSGTRGLQTCVIPENGSTCQTTMTWDTISPYSSYLTSFVSTNANIPAPASGNNGSHNFSLNQNTINSILSSGSTNGIASIINAKNKVDGENNGPVVDNQLFTVNLAVACDKGAWNGTMCKKHELAVSKNPMGGGSITMPDPGSTCGVTCVGSTISYNYGTSQTVTASPASGYTFSHWVNNTPVSGDNCPNNSTSTSCTLKMNANRAVTAVFKQMTGTLSCSSCVIQAPQTSCNGTITWAVTNPIGTTTKVTTPTNITVGEGHTGSAQYPLTTTPRNFYLYNNAQELNQVSCVATTVPVPLVPTIQVNPGSCVTTGQSIINVTWNAVVGATGYDLSIDNGASIPLNVTSFSHININMNQIYSYKVRAKNANGNSDWSSSVSATAPSFCPVITTSVIPEVGGTIAPVPFSNPPYTVNHGARKVFTITKNSGYKVSSVSGTCGGTYDAEDSKYTTDFVTNSCTVIVNFIKIPQRLSVSRLGSGSGTVQANIGGINCGTTCFDNYDNNTIVFLQAQPSPDSAFLGWSGACSNVMGNACSLTMNSTKNAVATFGKKSGTLNATDCLIDAGSNSCISSVSWNTINPSGTSAVTSNMNDLGQLENNFTLYNGNSGNSKPVKIFHYEYTPRRTIFLYNTIELASVTPNAICKPETNWNGSICEGILPGQPDLTARRVEFSGIGLDKILSAEIRNIGNATTGRGFSSFFQYSTVDPEEVNPGNPGFIEKINPDGSKETETETGTKINRLYNSLFVKKVVADSEISDGGDIGDGTSRLVDLPPVSVREIDSQNSENIDSSVRFPMEGTYWVRACADKRDRNDGGLILESNENNNCSAWVATNITQEGEDGKCSKEIGKCDVGEPTDPVEIPNDGFFWTCKGINGGTIVPCYYYPQGSGVGGIEIEFNAKPVRIIKNRSSTLSWKVKGNVESCSLTNDKGESDPIRIEGEYIRNGSQKVSPTTTTKYTLTCQEGDGFVNSKDATVKVTDFLFREI
jgi:hypothetical protein